MGKFEDNNSIGTGRPKGTPNKITNEVRQTFSELLRTNLEKIQSDLDAIKRPETRLKLIFELASFVIPKMKLIEIDNSEAEQSANDQFLNDLMNIEESKFNAL